MQRWSGSESLHRTTYYVPSVIAAYNLYMNSVDRMDQKRATNATKRKEQRLYMTIFTYILDLACHQAFSLLQTMRPRENLSFQEFKRDLCEELVSEFRKKRKRTLQEALDKEKEKQDKEKNIGKKSHMLIENLNKVDINCHMCLIRGQKKKNNLWVYGLWKRIPR